MSRVKHVVLVRLKPDTSPGTVTELFTALKALQQTIPGIVDVSAGANCSPEGLSKGFTHGFVVTFTDAASRDRYLSHPDHEVVKELLLRLIDGGAEGVTVLDWHE